MARMIQVAKRELDLSDDAYRDAVGRAVKGKSSAKGCSNLFALGNSIGIPFNRYIDSFKGACLSRFIRGKRLQGMNGTDNCPELFCLGKNAWRMGA